MNNLKILNSRVISKHDTSSNWEKASTFIPYAGELILYTDVYKIKIGDGITPITELPFATGTPDEIAAKYTKPSTGIPLEDLNSSTRLKINQSNKEAYLTWEGLI